MDAFNYVSFSYFQYTPRWCSGSAMRALANVWNRISEKRGISKTKAKTAIMAALESKEFAEFVVNYWNENFPNDKI